MSSISQASHGRIATMAAKALMLVYTFSLVPQVVLGHGFVQKVTINGQDYGGFDEPNWSKSQGSPVLVTDYLLPSYDVTTRYISLFITVVFAHLLMCEFFVAMSPVASTRRLRKLLLPCLLTTRSGGM